MWIVLKKYTWELVVTYAYKIISFLFCVLFTIHNELHGKVWSRT